MAWCMLWALVCTDRAPSFPAWAAPAAAWAEATLTPLAAAMMPRMPRTIDRIGPDMTSTALIVASKTLAIARLTPAFRFPVVDAVRLDQHRIELVRRKAEDEVEVVPKPGGVEIGFD
jgi:hypothetical protein